MRLRLGLIVAVIALSAVVVTLAAPAVTFPLRVSANRQHLEDSTGAPFLVVGDTAWSLVAQLNETDIERYLDDRAVRGFNAIIVNLLEHKFASHAPATVGGVQPFAAGRMFEVPNAKYFDIAHRAVATAGRRGISVWLCPAYLGWDGGDEGFFKEINAAGHDALRNYGRFVGERFEDLPNIVWMLGGDFAFPTSHRWLGDVLAAGLRDGGARQLMTAHGGQTAAVETFGDRDWIAVDTVYSYLKDLREPLHAARVRRPQRPFVLIESTYEGEHDAPPEQIRFQAWAAMLSGAAGQFFGNNPIWHFDGPTLFRVRGVVAASPRLGRLARHGTARRLLPIATVDRTSARGRRSGGDDGYWRRPCRGKQHGWNDNHRLCPRPQHGNPRAPAEIATCQCGAMVRPCWRCIAGDCQHRRRCRVPPARPHTWAKQCWRDRLGTGVAMSSVTDTRH